jgi:hypothetical protein
LDGFFYYRSSPNFWLLFSTEKLLSLSTKTGWGYTFTNSSGHLAQLQISQNVTSIMSPDMQRVKVEIGRQFSPVHHLQPAANLSSSPVSLNEFGSPRKRYLQVPIS